MTSQPLVSVAIPAYNHAKFIEDCLASVCAQTYPALELVLIDDGSTDGTFELAQKFLERHPERFRRVVLERRKNQGVSANSNACIESCQGEWVHLLGSDDIIHPTKIARMQQFIADWGDANLALVHADCDFIGSDGSPVVRSKQKTRPLPGPDYAAYRWLFLGEHFIFNPTIALHRARFLSIGGFDPSLPLEDLDCWLRLSTLCGIARVPEVLASYRKHPGNSSRRRLAMLAAQLNTFAKFLQTQPGLIDERSLRRHFRAYVKRFWRRSRKLAPWVFPKVISAALSSYWRTPQADDYARFGNLLESLRNRASRS